MFFTVLLPLVWVNLVIHVVPCWYVLCSFSSYTKLKSTVPLKIKKVVVQTREDVESSKKLRFENAIFYISFSDRDQIEDHRAVVRRITDGIPGHVCLEVKVRFGTCQALCKLMFIINVCTILGVSS